MNLQCLPRHTLSSYFFIYLSVKEHLTYNTQYLANSIHFAFTEHAMEESVAM